MPNDGVGNTKNTKTMYKAFEIAPAMWRGIRADAPTGGAKDTYDIDGNYVTPPVTEMWRTAPILC